MSTTPLYNEANGPTPEHRAKLGANMAVGKTGDRKGIPQVRYRNFYELVADPEKDMLKESYGDCFSRLHSAHYAYLVAMKANASKRSDTGGEGDPDGIPQADFYLAVQKRFHDHRSACARQGHRVDRWGTILWLMEELPAGWNEEQIRINQNAMLKIVPSIETALDLLAEYSEDISRAYRDARDTEKSSCGGYQVPVN